MLEREFKYYIKHQAELVKDYNNKYIVVIGESVVGAYNSIKEAYCESLEKYEEGTFLIQYCEFGIEAYTQTYHSRAAFI